MEWSWLRDWWRLKRLRHSQTRHSNDDLYYSYSDDEFDDDDICYCDDCMNVCFFLLFLNSGNKNSRLYFFAYVFQIAIAITLTNEKYAMKPILTRICLHCFHIVFFSSLGMQNKIG